MLRVRSQVAALALLASPGCHHRVCKAANLPLVDDVPVNGTTAWDVRARAEGTFEGLWVRWYTGGGVTEVRGRIEGVPGTARRVNRPDCVPDCHTRYQLAMACGPDSLRQDARAWITTTDGRLQDVLFEGTLASHGGEGWRFSGFAPLDRIPRAFERDEFLQDERYRILGVWVFVGGVGEVVSRASFDSSATWDPPFMVGSVSSAVLGVPFDPALPDAPGVPPAHPP